MPPAPLFYRLRVALAVVIASLPGVSTSATGDDVVVFNRDIRPILSDNCFRCHGPDGAHREAELRLDQAEGATADLDGRAAIVPGQPQRSELLLRVESSDPDELMPPPDSGKKLSAAEVRLLRQWIAQGAPYEAHWSYAPLRAPPLPLPADRSWSAGPLDAFIRTAQEQAGLQPAASADRVTLARRVHFDLTGLPPTPEQLAQFVNDSRPGAYQRLVDRLLASPRFGERMAIYWLDLVRYADSVGYHGDQEHQAAPYREYVIRAFNQAMPFDQFTREQLAGDLLPEPTVDQRVASGYNRLLQTTHEGGAQDKEYLAKYAADRVRNLSAVWMGATVGCCECHDHKYDPYTQADFYNLAAFFADLQEQGTYSAANSSPTQRPPEIVAPSPADRLLLQRIERQLSQQPTKQQRAALQARRQRVQARALRQMVSQVRDQPRPMRLLPRGDWMDESGPPATPAPPAFLPPLDHDQPRATRLDLANWLVSREQPQTARVLVNRLWFLFFGAGLSRVLEDTGSQGQWPTHPQLLDYLAHELIEGGWQLKPLIRQIVSSSAYCQSSRPTSRAEQLDPQNRLWTRQGRHRLPAETIRDQALLVSGLLVERTGGPSSRPYQPVGYYAHLNFPQRKYKPDADAGQYRRGVYMHWQRQFLHPMLRAFDAPSREECTSQRVRSNTPQAALALLNDPTFVEAARRLAARTWAADPALDDTRRIERLWQLALGRLPAPNETRLLRLLLDSSRRRYEQDPPAARLLLEVGLSPRGCDQSDIELAAWTGVARAVLGLHETVTRQ